MDLSEVKVDEVLRLGFHGVAKVVAADTVPRRVVLVVELHLDVVCDSGVNFDKFPNGCGPD